MSILNQFSFVVTTMAVGVILVAILWRIQRFPIIARVVVMILYVLAMLGVNLLMRYPDSPAQATTVADVDAILADGKPTFLMLYSNY